MAAASSCATCSELETVKRRLAEQEQEIKRLKEASAGHLLATAMLLEKTKVLAAGQENADRKLSEVSMLLTDRVVADSQRLVMLENKAESHGRILRTLSERTEAKQDGGKRRRK